MSVLIKDMKMPPSCKECKLYYEVEDNIDSPMQCILSPYYRWRCIDDVPDDYREDNCPLVELPEKHGRLLDGDALMNIFADRLNIVSERYGIDSAVAGAVAGAMGLVDAQPTVIEAEGEG